MRGPVKLASLPFRLRRQVVKGWQRRRLDHATFAVPLRDLEDMGWVVRCLGINIGKGAVGRTQIDADDKTHRVGTGWTHGIRAAF